MSHHYYYLHTNGDLIHKPAAVVDRDPQYFDSPFVRHYWRADDTDRKDAWLICIEALALGARLFRVEQLAHKWNLTREDMPEFLCRHPRPDELQRKGLRLFISQILELDPEKVFDEIAAMGTKTV